MKKVIYIILFALITTGGVGGIYFYKIFYESNTLFNEEYVFVKIPTNSTENQLLDSIGKHVKDLSKFSLIISIVIFGFLHIHPQSQG